MKPINTAKTIGAKLSPNPYAHLHARVVYDPTLLATLEEKFNKIAATGYSSCPGTISVSTVSSSRSPTPVTSALDEITRTAMPRLFYNFNGEVEAYAGCSEEESSDVGDIHGFDLEEELPVTLLLQTPSEPKAPSSPAVEGEKLSPASVASSFYDMAAPGATALLGAQTTFGEHYGVRTPVTKLGSGWLQNPRSPRSPPVTQCPSAHRERTPSMYAPATLPTADAALITGVADECGIAFASQKQRKLIHSPSPTGFSPSSTQPAVVPQLDPLTITVLSPLPVRPAVPCNIATGNAIPRSPVSLGTPSPMRAPTPDAPVHPTHRKHYQRSDLVPTRLVFEDETPPAEDESEGNSSLDVHLSECISAVSAPQLARANGCGLSGSRDEGSCFDDDDEIDVDIDLWHDVLSSLDSHSTLFATNCDQELPGDFGDNKGRFFRPIHFR